MTPANDLMDLAALIPGEQRNQLLAILDAAPRVPAPRAHAAALVFSNRTGELHLVPVLAFDFYPKEPT